MLCGWGVMAYIRRVFGDRKTVWSIVRCVPLHLLDNQSDVRAVVRLSEANVTQCSLTVTMQHVGLVLSGYMQVAYWMKESKYYDLLSHSFPNQINCFCSFVGTELSFISYFDDLQYQWLSVVSIFRRLISTNSELEHGRHPFFHSFVHLFINAVYPPNHPSVQKAFNIAKINEY